MDLSLVNKGNKISESGLFTIDFNQELNVTLLSGENWNQEQYNHLIWNYDGKNSLIIYPNSETLIGKFIINLPKKDNKFLMAIFFVKGDFIEKTGLVYFDYTKNEYEIITSENRDRLLNIWNENQETKWKFSKN